VQKIDIAMPIKYNTASADYPKGLIGIIDIGSNSVRMVVYHALKRVPLPLFNEKYMCGLGKGLARTGRLNPAGVKSARLTLARFMLMAERLQLASLDILATAAVRDAEDGQKFVEELQREFGIRINVISGEREAELAAKGIIASVHDPLGISADLGGGSMELASVERRSIGLTTTCSLGSLRILDASEGKTKAMQEIIKRELKDIPWLKNAHPHCLYAIGGGFRTLAKLHMRKTHYPLAIVHEYTMSRRTIAQLIDKLLALSPAEIASLPGISQKRAPTMIPTALVLQQLLEVTAAPEVMFSVSGIREGFFYDLLSPKLQQEDALTASATDLAALIGRQGEYAEELFRWMEPLFVNEPIGWRRLRFALCTLSELAWSIDPLFRAEWAYHRIIQSSLKGLDHKERIMLALALYHRYQPKWKSERAELKLLDERERLWARCTGLAAGLAYQFSGGRAGNLYHAQIRLVNTQLTLALDADASPLRTEAVEKRLDGLGEAFKAFSNFVL
jgi:exopolyphosphatase/guanosine-5'-triphosphate,3'-diphosphate pyrophosphatase